MVELTKSQKKKVRILIDKGIMRDYRDGIKQIKAICDSFEEGKSDPKEYYLKLFSTLDRKDNQIGKRYNNLGGSKYFMCLVMLIADGVIARNEIEDLDEELKAKIAFLTDKPNTAV